MKDSYIYPAIFTEDSDGIAVEFPDFPGCHTCAEDVEHALGMAREALGLHIYGMEQDGDQVPEPSKAYSLKSELESNQVLVLVETWMPLVRGETEAVKKTVTIPKWLNDLAEKRKVNFSRTLQAALQDELGVHAGRPEPHKPGVGSKPSRD